MRNSLGRCGKLSLSLRSSDMSGTEGLREGGRWAEGRGGGCSLSHKQASASTQTQTYRETTDPCVGWGCNDDRIKPVILVTHTHKHMSTGRCSNICCVKLLVLLFVKQQQTQNFVLYYLHEPWWKPQHKVILLAGGCGDKKLFCILVERMPCFLISTPSCCCLCVNGGFSCKEVFSINLRLTIKNYKWLLAHHLRLPLPLSRISIT